MNPPEIPELVSALRHLEIMQRYYTDALTSLDQATRSAGEPITLNTALPKPGIRWPPCVPPYCLLPPEEVRVQMQELAAYNAQLMALAMEAMEAASAAGVETIHIPQPFGMGPLK